FIHSGPIYGPRFDHVASPCRVISGTITDQKTGKPLPNVAVTGRVRADGWENQVHCKSGADGTYRLLGLPNAECELTFVHAEKDSPYLRLRQLVQPTLGLLPATCDMTLVPGVVVSGRVTDRDTGQPIQGYLHYALLDGNP